MIVTTTITETVTKMALSGYEKQKRWREKNRALYNLQQRNRRKRKNLPVPVLAESNPSVPVMTNKHNAGDEARESTLKHGPVRGTNILTTDSRGGQPFRLIEIDPEPLETNEEARPVVFRNDLGQPISEKAWNKLEELKRKAKEGGYEYDEYSQ